MMPKGTEIRSRIKRLADRRDAFASRRSRVNLFLYCSPGVRDARHGAIEEGTGPRAGMLFLHVDVTYRHVADVPVDGLITPDRRGGATAPEPWFCWPPDADPEDERPPTPEEIARLRRAILAHATPAQRRILLGAATWQVVSPDALRHYLGRAAGDAPQILRGGGAPGPSYALHRGMWI